jgi:flagellar motor switch protein FliM
MTPAHELQTLDFHDPRRLASASSRLLQRWQRDTCERVVESWTSLLVSPPRVKTVSIAPIRYGEGLKSVADPGVGIVIALGREEIPTLFTFSTRHLLGLLEGMLAEVDAWPEPHELTELEMTMADVLFQKLIESTSEGWPGLEPLRSRIEDTCRPRRSRLFPPETELIAVRWEVAVGALSEETVWLMPRREMEELAGEQFTLGPLPADPKSDLEQIALELPVEVVVELGRASLSMSEIAGLQVGDLIILDQPVDRPLVSRVSGLPRWTGQPCRVGSRQAFDIRSAPLR